MRMEREYHITSTSPSVFCCPHVMVPRQILLTSRSLLPSFVLSIAERIIDLEVGFFDSSKAIVAEAPSTKHHFILEKFLENCE